MGSSRKILSFEIGQYYPFGSGNIPHKFFNTLFALITLCVSAGVYLFFWHIICYYFLWKRERKMARKKLPTIIKKCEREGCENTFEVKVGAKYQKKYCSPRCAAIATREARKHRRRKRRYPVAKEREAVKKVFSIIDLQNFPVNFDESDGGKFAEICNGILNGELTLVGIE